jgi:NADPH-dependent 2,4-dienoyl-CoA reductase/sulfur reductase-like enzyme
VTLFEREQEPGGQMLLSRHAPGREEFAGHLPWLAGEAERAGVRMHLGVEADADLVLAEAPDAVIVATGAAPGLPAIPGIVGAPVVEPYAILRRPLADLGRALVIGGGIRGVAVARLLAERNVDVVLVEPGDELVQDIAMRSRRFQIAALEASGRVTVCLRTTVEALGERSAILWNGRERRELAPVDLVVPTRMLLPVTTVADALVARAPQLDVHVVGDCSQPRTALEAIHDAAALAHRL